VPGPPSTRRNHATNKNDTASAVALAEAAWEGSASLHDRPASEVSVQWDVLGSGWVCKRIFGCRDNNQEENADS